MAEEDTKKKTQRIKTEENEAAVARLAKWFTCRSASHALSSSEHLSAARCRPSPCTAPPVARKPTGSRRPTRTAQFSRPALGLNGLAIPSAGTRHPASTAATFF